MSPHLAVTIVRLCLKDGHRASSPYSVGRLAFASGVEQGALEAFLSVSNLSVFFLLKLSQEPVALSGGLVCAAAKCLAYATSDAEREALHQLIAMEELAS